MSTSILLLASATLTLLSCTMSRGADAITCSSPNITGSVYSTATGILASDADGSGNGYHYGASEACSWTVTCPTGNVILVLSGSMSGGTDQVLQVGTDRSFTGSMDDLQVMTNSTSVAVQFTTSSATQSPQLPHQPAGWTIQWSCSVATCLSPVAADTIFNVANASIISDADGAGVTSYALGQSCAFHIQCPSGMGYNYLALYSLVKIQDVHSLKVFDSAGSLLTSLLNSGSTYKKTQIFSATNVTILWDTMSTSARRADRGWNVDWKCLKSHCSARTLESGTHTVPVSTPTIIQSDFDGSGGSTYAVGESCQWDIDCPVGYQFLKLTYSSKIGTSASDRLVLASTENNYATLFTIGTGTATEEMVRIALANSTTATTTQLLFASSKFNAPKSGFTLSVECVVNSCSSPNASGIVTTQMSGTLYSDPDGVGSNHSITETERCDWTVQCPAGYHFAVTRFLSNFTYSSDLKIQYLAGNGVDSYATRSDFEFYYSDGWSYGYRTHHVPQSAVFKGWGKAKIVFKNSPVDANYTYATWWNSSTGSYEYLMRPKKRVGGYTLDWACLPEPCYSSVPSGALVNATVGVISLGPLAADGYSGYGTLGSHCTWDFPYCSDGSRPTFKLTYGTYSLGSGYYRKSGKSFTYYARALYEYPHTSPINLYHYCTIVASGTTCLSPNSTGSALEPFSTTIAQGETATIWATTANPNLYATSSTGGAQTCTWSFSCENTENYLVLDFTGKWSNTSTASYLMGATTLDTTSGSIIRPIAGSFYNSYGYTLTVVAPGKSASVSVRKAAISGGIYATCQTKEACYHPYGKIFTPVANSYVTIRSDASGLSSRGRVRIGSNCRYTVRCPTTHHINVTLMGYLFPGIVLSFYNTTTTSLVGPTGNDRRWYYATRGNAMNVSFAHHEVDVGWYSDVQGTHFSTGSYGFEIDAHCVTPGKIPLPEIPSSSVISEQCSVASSHYKVSRVAERITFSPPSTYPAGLSGGCYLKIDCTGVTGAHTMVIAHAGNSKYSDYNWSPFERIFETSSGRMLYNLTTRSYTASYDYKLGNANTFVLSAKKSNAAVIQFRKVSKPIALSVFCLNSQNMIPSKKSSWFSFSTQTTGTGTTGYSTELTTDIRMQQFSLYPVSSQSYSSSVYDGYRQFYRDNIDEFSIVQCQSGEGPYYDGSTENYMTDHRVQVSTVSGNIKPGASGSTDKLTFVDGENGDSVSISDTSYKTHTDVGITSYAVLVHFRSGSSGKTPLNEGFGYEYTLKCGKFSQGESGCPSGQVLDHYGSCTNGAASRFSMSSILVAVLVALAAPYPTIE